MNRLPKERRHRHRHRRYQCMAHSDAESVVEGMQGGARAWPLGEAESLIRHPRAWPVRARRVQHALEHPKVDHHTVEVLEKRQPRAPLARG